MTVTRIGLESLAAAIALVYASAVAAEGIPGRQGKQIGDTATAGRGLGPTPPQVQAAKMKAGSVSPPTEQQIRQIESAAPQTAPARPARPRKVLVWGHVWTHTPNPAAAKALEILGKKTGAFTAVVSDDPRLLLTDRLSQFDALVMNNIHEPEPFLPEDYGKLPADQRSAAKKFDAAVKQSILGFVRGGKGIVGIHAATAALGGWREYGEMIGGFYGGHITEEVAIKVDDPKHPLNACFDGKPWQIRDEVYTFREPYARNKVHVLLSLDLARMADPGKRADKDYPISWVRQYGKGRVFYTTLGHFPDTYWNALFLRHLLAGVQYAVGDAGAAPKVVKASSFGFDPADATRALQAAIDSGASKVIVDNPGKPWIVRPITLAGNQEVVFEKGVEVLAKKGEFKGRNDSLFRAHLKQDIALTGYGAVLRMRRSDYAEPPYVKAEWRHVLDFQSCANVRVCGLTLAESGGDGIYLGTAKQGVPNKDIHIKDVVCDKNYRQGISVINAENLLIENCVLRDTAGTAPQAGIDFEPNLPGERLVNCTMRHCVSENNAGGGFLLALQAMAGKSTPISLRFEHCQSKGDRQWAALVSIGNSAEHGVPGLIEFSDCIFQESRGSGILIAGKAAEGCRVRFVKCSLLDVAASQANTTPIVLVADQGAERPMGGIELADCTIRDRVKRKPISLVDMAGGVGLKDLTGNLLLDTGAQRTNVTITERLLAEWIPSSAIRRIPRLTTAGMVFKPASARRTEKPAALPPVRLRQTARLVIYATQGDEVEFRVRYLPVGHYSGRTMPLAVTAPSGREVRRVDLPFKEETEVRFAAAETGLYRVTAEPGLNYLQVSASSHPVALSGEANPIHFVSTPGEFFFWVPAGTRLFGVRVCGEGLGEGVKAALVDPKGKVVEELDNVASVRQFEVNRPEGSPGEVWSLRLSRPSRLVMEDHYVDLRGIPPLVATSRDAVLKPER